MMRILRTWKKHKRWLKPVIQAAIVLFVYLYIRSQSRKIKQLNRDYDRLKVLVINYVNHIVPDANLHENIDPIEYLQRNPPNDVASYAAL